MTEKKENRKALLDEASEQADEATFKASKILRETAQFVDQAKLGSGPINFMQFCLSVSLRIQENKRKDMQGIFEQLREN